MYLTHTLLAEYLTAAQLPYAVHAVAAPVISIAGVYGAHRWFQGRIIDSRLAEEALYYTTAAIIVHILYHISEYGRHGIEARHMAALLVTAQAIQSREAVLVMPCMVGAIPYALRAYGLLTGRGFRWLYAGTCVGWPITVLMWSRMTNTGCAVLMLGTILAALELTRII